MRKHLLGAFFVLSLLLVGCPRTSPQSPSAKYQPGYTTLNVARMVITNAHSAFTSYEFNLRRGCNIKICVKIYPDTSTKDYRKCIYRSHAEEEAFKKCYGQMAEMRPIVEKAVPLAISVIDGARASLDFAVAYETAKEISKVSGDPKKLQEFCAVAYPTKKGTKYRSCLKGESLEKADWYGLLKKGACIVYNAVVYAPDKYAKYVDAIRTWAKAIAGSSCR